MIKEGIDRDIALLRRVEQVIQEESSNIPDVSLGLDGTENMSNGEAPNKALKELYSSEVAMALAISDFVDTLNVAYETG